MPASHANSSLSREQRLLRLQVRCDIERQILVRDGQALRPVFSALDQCGELVQATNGFSKPIKVAILAGLAGFVITRPSKALGLVTKGLRYWTWWQRLAPLISAAKNYRTAAAYQDTQCRD